jgi:hypothetical protein
VFDAEQPASDSRGKAVLTLRQVRDYLIDLDLESKPGDECLEVCRDLLGSLNGSAKALGGDLAGACQALSDALTSGSSDAEPTGSKQRLVRQKYDSVARLMPELGSFEAERRRRVKLIVRAILEDVPGLGPLGRGKLQQAGFGEVDELCRATPRDLQQAGLTAELAERVFDRVARFKRRLNSVPPAAGRTSERRRLRRLTQALKQQNQRFESLADDWKKGSSEARRVLRDERAETMSQVSLLLARLGELGISERIQRLPFDKKASELELLVQTLDDTHGHSP